MTDDTQTTQQQAQQTQPESTQQTQQTPELDLGQFKNPKDLLKSYKEIQGAFTRISQEKKARDKELADLQEQVSIMRLNSQATPPPRPQTKPLNEAIFENPGEVITNIVAQENVKSRIAEILEEEHLKGPDDFQERYAVVNMLSQNPQYVQLCRSGQGVKKLFQIADKFREERIKVNARKALEGIFGEPLDDEAITFLKETVTKKKSTTQPNTPLGNAYMPDGSTSTRTGSEPQTRDHDAAQMERMKRGDVDGVISATFEKVLAE
jgi:hypothetical protein